MFARAVHMRFHRSCHVDAAEWKPVADGSGRVYWTNFYLHHICWIPPLFPPLPQLGPAISPAVLPGDSDLGRKETNASKSADPVPDPEEPAGEVLQHTKHVPYAPNSAELRQLEMELDVLAASELSECFS